jgi:hypothetical protein
VYGVFPFTLEIRELCSLHRKPEVITTAAPAASRIACIETTVAAETLSSPQPQAQLNSLALKFLLKFPIQSPSFCQGKEKSQSRLQTYLTLIVKL